MVVSRSNCKPISNKISEEILDKCHNGSLTEPITVIINSSSDEDGNTSSLNTIIKPTTVTFSDYDVNVNGFLSDRPKRNIERTNYNQSKMMKQLYKRNMSSSTVSQSTRQKRQTRDHQKLTKIAERALRKMSRNECTSDPHPPANAIDIDSLLSSITNCRRLSVVAKPLPGRRPKTEVCCHDDESANSKFASISNRAFRYPWEWQNVQKAISSSQIFGFRTLNDGLCETLMCLRK